MSHPQYCWCGCHHPLNTQTLRSNHHACRTYKEQFKSPSFSITKSNRFSNLGKSSFMTPAQQKPSISVSYTNPVSVSASIGVDQSTHVPLTTSTRQEGHWQVHKFGGSSLENVECFERVSGLLQEKMLESNVESVTHKSKRQHGQTAESSQQRFFIVVSAVRGVTNILERLIYSAIARNKDLHYLEGIEELRDIHENLIERLLSPEERHSLLATLSSNLRDLRDLLRAVWIARSASVRIRDLIMGYGELWCAQLVWALLRSKGVQCSFLDARDVLVTRTASITSNRNEFLLDELTLSDLGNVNGMETIEPKKRLDKLTADSKTSKKMIAQPRKIIDWDISKSRLDSWLRQNPTQVVVATGYIACDADGVPTTLGRNGSDFSASVFGRILEAESITIWTDVDGVYSADPRVVPDAVVIPFLSYKEAAELAYFGADVLHPDTMSPAIFSSIPIRIRNTFRPHAEGTLIGNTVSESILTIPSSPSNVSPATASAKANVKNSRGVKGFSTVKDIALVNVEGTGMIGVPGIASRLFEALYSAGLSVIMIAQASSEYSICSVVPGSQADLAVEAVRYAFRTELAEGLVSSVDTLRNCSILAVVGENMQEVPGVSSRLFGSLSRVGVSVRAVAQGSSEHNISIVVDSKDESRALRASHAAFYLSDQTLSVGILGTGTVGGTLINQIRQQIESLRLEFGVDIRIRGIANSKKMLLVDSLQGTVDWNAELEQEQQSCNLDMFAKHIQDTSIPHAVICDCTASDVVTEKYADWLAQGIHLVTANKKANSGSMKRYIRLREAQRAANSHFLYEANVGAGLPVISSLRDLIRTGDKLKEIEGIFSGTLSYIFNEFDGSESFSTVVKRAKDKGYTEPDPRDDLSGMDVARKIIILAREIGLHFELSDLQVESLVPEELRADKGVNVETFLRRLPEYDEELGRLALQAKENNQVLRYVGVVSVEQHNCRVELRRYDQVHPFGRLKGSDNIVSFRTWRYDNQPLVVQGPGAGADVTAGGVFADLLRLASYLGAPSSPMGDFSF
ncbi:hypothetical protein GpartN1_g6149.t1 [Galdieria partita]|uniref:ACT domain-containing protein n=1 Tax=Galdieria partita TaxID=83374 RepID=A0A9C7Q0S6_9RHOD|nr:hypothetical protein GpartN1_g6149.t1 [Galdieria partita]